MPILLDIPRTFPDHPRFGVNGTDRDLLFNVLRAYANFNPEIGYTQGMSFIAAVLLMHMNEETAFWVFVQMLKRYQLAAFFTAHVYPDHLKSISDAFHVRLPTLEDHMVRVETSQPFSLELITLESAGLLGGHLRRTVDAHALRSRL